MKCSLQLSSVAQSCPTLCSLRISNFLEEISSLSHSVFLYFFALIIEEGFLISPCYSLELCLQMCTSFLFFAFHFSSFLHYLQGLLRQPFCLFAFLFLGAALDHCTMSRTSIHSSLGTLSIRSNPFYLFVTSTVKCVDSCIFSILFSSFSDHLYYHCSELFFR